MAKNHPFSLIASSPLSGFDAVINDVHIQEIPDFAIVSIAVARDASSAFEKALKKAFGFSVPVSAQDRAGTSILGKNQERLIWVTPDQYWMLFPKHGNRPELAIAAVLAGTGYVTDQSDGLAVLQVSGKNCRLALERICPIDLHQEQFAVNSAARTQMDHLGVTIIRTDIDEFMLLSSRSSAYSFLHAVEASAKNL